MFRCLSFHRRNFTGPVVRFSGRLLIVATAATLLWGAENSKKPISRERLFRAAEIGGLSSDEFIGIIKDFGVDFELNSEDRQNLSKAGVDEVVMAAIGANFRDPIKEKITQLTQGGPLAKDNIIGLLKAGAGSEIIEALVDKRGVSFAMTPQDAKEIEGSGGSKGLLGTLLLKEPVKVAAVAPPPQAVAPQVNAPAGASIAAKEPVPMAVSTPNIANTPSAPSIPQSQEPAKTATQPPATTAQPVTNTAAVKAPATPPAASATVPPPAAPAPNPAAPPAAAANAQPVNQAAAMLTSGAKPAKLIKGGVQFSEAARRVHATGKVLMEIVINEKGRVETVKAISGNPLLVMSAAQSMKDWIYEPASIDGRPTKVSTQVNVDFQ